MTSRKVTPSGGDLKALLLSDEDGFRAVLQEALQAVLEAEMTEALQAEKGERTGERASAGKAPPIAARATTPKISFFTMSS